MRSLLLTFLKTVLKLLGPSFIRVVAYISLSKKSQASTTSGLSRSTCQEIRLITYGSSLASILYIQPARNVFIESFLVAIR